MWGDCCLQWCPDYRSAMPGLHYTGKILDAAFSPKAPHRGHVSACAALAACTVTALLTPHSMGLACGQLCMCVSPADVVRPCRHVAQGQQASCARGIEEAVTNTGWPLAACRAHVKSAPCFTNQRHTPGWQLFSHPPQWDTACLTLCQALRHLLERWWQLSLLNEK